MPGAARQGVPADPARIAAQIVSGIGFLGAGTIIQSRIGVTGLTTAATLWVVAAIGMAVGAGAYPEAVGTTAVVIVALLVLSRLGNRMPQHFEGRLQVTLIPDDVLADRVESLVGSHLELAVVAMERRAGEIELTYTVTGTRRRWTALLGELRRLDGVRRVEGG